MTKYGWRDNSVISKDLTVKNDLSIEGDMSFGDASTDTLTVNGAATFESTVDFDNATTYTPTVALDTSMYPLRITYNYPGATANTGVDMDLYGIRSTITQTTSNDKATLGQRGYIQGIRSDSIMDGFLDTCYAVYGKVTASGDSTVNGMYGMTSIVTLGAHTISLDETGFIAGFMTSINGSGDVTCAGTGYGKVAGVYVAWQDSNALTVDSCGFHLGVHAASTLDSGYRVNNSGTLTNSFHSMNTSGTPTNALKIEGAHTNVLALPALSTAPVSGQTTADYTFTKYAKLAITIGGATYYLIADTTA